MSMSDFHPESWNPMWSVATILTGLYSFMLEDAPTLGSVDAPAAQRRELAARSLAFNVRDDQFRRLFPELVAEHDARRDAYDGRRERRDAPQHPDRRAGPP